MNNFHPPYPVPQQRICLSQNPACSGCQPCEPCFQAVEQEVLVKAMIAGGLNGSREQAMYVLHGWSQAWQQLRMQLAVFMQQQRMAPPGYGPPNYAQQPGGPNYAPQPQGMPQNPNVDPMYARAQELGVSPMHVPPGFARPQAPPQVPPGYPPQGYSQPQGYPQPQQAGPMNWPPGADMPAGAFMDPRGVIVLPVSGQAPGLPNPQVVDMVPSAGGEYRDQFAERRLIEEHARMQEMIQPLSQPPQPQAPAPPPPDPMPNLPPTNTLPQNLQASPMDDEEILVGAKPAGAVLGSVMAPGFVPRAKREERKSSSSDVNGAADAPESDPS